MSDTAAAPAASATAEPSPERDLEVTQRSLRAWWRRTGIGRSGVLPVVVGLIVIVVVFQLEKSHFGSNQNLVSLFEQASIFALLGAAEVFVLVVSEIDLSVGYVLGIGGFAIAELSGPPVNLPWWAAIIGGLGVTGTIGFLQGSLVTRLRVPSFLVTLAGLFIWDGAMIELAKVDKSAVGGVMSLSPTSPVYRLVNSSMSPALGWAVLGVLLSIVAAWSLTRARRRARTVMLVGLAAVAGVLLVYVCNSNRSSGTIPLRGVPWVLPFVGLVLVLYSTLLRRTRLGRVMYSIGANSEAAQRSGINVERIRRLAFTLSALTAGLAGLVYASSQGSISTDVPGANYTLYGLAAAVIGGASLFGARGRPVHALLGGLAVGAVYNGLELINVSPQGQFIASGVLLLLAATLDARVRRRDAAQA